jgi:capsid assembly protease
MATTLSEAPAIPPAMADYIHAYGGPWAITVEEANRIASIARQTDLRAHLASAAEERQAKQAKRAKKAAEAAMDDDELDDDEEEEVEPFALTGDGVAIIEARGTLMKFVPSLMRGTSTVALKRSFRLAKSDQRVRGIMLVIESPGGSVAGLYELADEIAAVNKVKPVWTFAEDLMCSAAQAIASQTARIGAMRTSMVGSCGTIYSLWDTSKMFAEAGVEVIIIESGDLKGAGADGTVITTKQKAYFQGLIDEQNAHFVELFRRGRPNANIKKLFASAACYVAEPSGLDLGLIDEVTAFDPYYASFVSKLNEADGGAPRLSPSDQKPKLAAAVDDAVIEQSVLVESTPAPAGEGVDMSTPTTAGANPGAAGGAQPATNAGAAKPAETMVAGAALLRTESVADRISALEMACPGADATFINAQLKADASIETAQRAYIKQQGETLAAHTKTLGERDAALATANAEIASLKGTVNTGQANAVNKPVEQTPTGQNTSVVAAGDQDIGAMAKADWEANKDGIQQKFTGDMKSYVAFRKAETRVRGKSSVAMKP